MIIQIETIDIIVTAMNHTNKNDTTTNKKVKNCIHFCIISQSGTMNIDRVYKTDFYPLTSRYLTDTSMTWYFEWGTLIGYLLL